MPSTAKYTPLESVVALLQMKPKFSRSKVVPAPSAATAASASAHVPTHADGPSPKPDHMSAAATELGDGNSAADELARLA